MDILKEAQVLTATILKLTNALVLTGRAEKEEEEVEAYAKLIEERQPLVDKLAELKKGIDAVKASSPEFAVIRKTIEAIADLDRRHLNFMEGKRDMVKTSHKDLKTGQKLHNAYMDLSPQSTSRSFDIKK